MGPAKVCQCQVAGKHRSRDHPIDLQPCPRYFDRAVIRVRLFTPGRGTGNVMVHTFRQALKFKITVSKRVHELAFGVVIYTIETMA